MAQPWDQRSPSEQRRIQNGLVNQTLVQMALAHVPFVRAKFQRAGIDARLIRTIDDLQKVPMTMRRDVVDPVRNPDGPHALVLKGTAEGVKRFSDRSVLWRVALSRLYGGEEHQQLAIEAASRSVHIHLADGPGGVIPISYTRDDLDLLARAGARLSRVLGLEREDRLANIVPFGPSLDFWGIFYMAHGTGMTALHTRREGGDLAQALAAAFSEGAPTAIALPADEAPEFPAALKESGVSIEHLRVVVAVGRSLSRSERERLGEALLKAGAPARIAAAYGPAEGRFLWGECSVPAGTTETFGFHTYSDMEVVEVARPDTGDPLAEEAPGEIVVTPLGFRGGGAPRWRTGDFALGGLTMRPCPNCGRTIPRLGPSVRRNAWQRRIVLGGHRVRFDFRDPASALQGAKDWQIELRTKDGSHEVFVYAVGSDNEVGPVIALYEAMSRWGTPPTQIVLSNDQEIARKHQQVEGPWPRFAER
ncbi:MAG: phenylacetate--CoA ligase family protein [Actinomycetota bacterium]